MFIRVFYVKTIWELQGVLLVIVKMCFCDHAFGMIMGSSGVRMLWMFFGLGLTRALGEEARGRLFLSVLQRSRACFSFRRADSGSAKPKTDSILHLSRASFA